MPDRYNGGYFANQGWEAAWQAAEADTSASYGEVSDAEYAQAVAETEATRDGQPADDPGDFEYEGEPEEE